MNLDKLTPQQRSCVEHVDGPLLVSAGAGSGKTFMLTQRIAYALLNPQISGVNDVDEVLAITFTEAAAGEIKARVRNKLREEGLGEQALKVDACWISTIHGMCSRILHENALELGLDPKFELLDDAKRDEAIDLCLEDALRESDAYDALMQEYDSRASDNSAQRMVVDLINEAANVRGGLDAVRTYPVMSPAAIAQTMLDAVVTVDSVAREDVSASGKQGSIAPKIRDMAEGENGRLAFERLAATGAGYDQVYRAVGNIETDLYRGKKEPFATAVAAFRQTVIEMRRECELGMAAPAREALLGLARDVSGRYEAFKREVGRLDQNDLLLKTLDAFDTHPEVLERYADRFKLVMVDEFQDTSGLQIALISHLTHGDERLCTVGDTQQSIYRFRGADVSTYLQHKRHMRELVPTGGLVCELGKNFRSHGDIIQFVNKVFSQDQVFGTDEFIQLGFDEGHADKPQNDFPQVPRVEVIATASPLRGGPNGADRTVAEADAVAERFCALHDTGSPNCRWADMVILLGRMTNAGVFAQALRSRGVPCTIAGGSGFRTTPEALGVQALSAVLVNPNDDQQMASVLAGPAFCLGSDELLLVATGDEGHKRNYWAGLTSCVKGEPAVRGQAFPQRSRLAASVLGHAVELVGERPLSQVVQEVAVESGWLARLQQGGAQGMAQAANLFKAIRLLEDIEQDDTSLGAASVAAMYAGMLQGVLKEKPGTLNTDEQDAVRILTIHASKGLEYPVVALADFYNKPMADKLTLEGVGEQVLLSLDAGESKRRVKVKDAPKLSETMLNRLAEGGMLHECSLDDEDMSAGQAADAIAEHAAREELAEQRRKFYVGATRPREALIIAVKTTISAKETPKDDCVNDVRCALFGPEGEWRNVPEGIDYGGTTPAVVTYRELGFDADRNVVVVYGAGAQEQGESDAAVGEAGEGCGITAGDGAGAVEEAVDGERSGGAAGEGCGILASDVASAVGKADGSVVCTSVASGADGAAVVTGDVSCANAAVVSDDAASVSAAATEGTVVETCVVPEAPREGEFVSDLEPLRLAYAPKRAATFSYTRLAAHDKDAADEDRGERRPADEDEDILFTLGAPHHASSTAFGSAVHQACQAMAEDLAWRKGSGMQAAGASDDASAGAGASTARRDGENGSVEADAPAVVDSPAPGFELPVDERLRACLATWDVPSFELKGLKRACALWCASQAAQRAASFDMLVPETPFYAALQGPQGEPIHIEGAFDLLCYDSAERQGGLAYIVDYKTGGSPTETPEELQAKHLLQASCYAYVAICQGFGEVELSFVRVEQERLDAPGTPQEVTYRFTADDRQQLHERIRAAYARL